MTVRDLEEMRAFKNSEARLLKRIEEGSAIDKIISEAGLEQLRKAHADYISGDAVLQLVTPLFDYADLDFEAAKEGDS